MSVVSSKSSKIQTNSKTGEGTKKDVDSSVEDVLQQLSISSKVLPRNVAQRAAMLLDPELDPLEENLMTRREESVQVNAELEATENRRKSLKEEMPFRERIFGGIFAQSSPRVRIMSELSEALPDMKEHWEDCKIKEEAAKEIVEEKVSDFLLANDETYKDLDAYWDMLWKVWAPIEPLLKEIKEAKTGIDFTSPWIWGSSARMISEIGSSMDLDKVYDLQIAFGEAIQRHNDWVKNNPSSRANPIPFGNYTDQWVKAIQERKSIIYTFGINRIKGDLDAIATEVHNTSKTIRGEFNRVYEQKEEKKKAIRELCKARDYN